MSLRSRLLFLTLAACAGTLASQPVDTAGAVRPNDFVADLALRAANAPERPSWLSNSFFRRFAELPVAVAGAAD